MSGLPRALVAGLVAALSLAACDGRPLSAPGPGSLARNPTVLENEKEGAADWEITAPGFPVRTFVIAAREDKQIAGEVRSLMG